MKSFLGNYYQTVSFWNGWDFKNQVVDFITISDFFKKNLFMIFIQNQILLAWTFFLRITGLMMPLIDTLGPFLGLKSSPISRRVEFDVFHMVRLNSGKIQHNVFNLSIFFKLEPIQWISKVWLNSLGIRIWNFYSDFEIISKSANVLIWDTFSWKIQLERSWSWKIRVEIRTNEVRKLRLKLESDRWSWKASN